MSEPQLAPGSKVHLAPPHVTPAERVACVPAVILEFKPGDDVEAKVSPGPGWFVCRDERYAHPPAVWDDDHSGYRPGTWHLPERCKVHAPA